MYVRAHRNSAVRTIHFGLPARGKGKSTPRRVAMPRGVCTPQGQWHCIIMCITTIMVINQMTYRTIEHTELAPLAYSVKPKHFSPQFLTPVSDPSLAPQFLTRPQ